MLKFMLDTNICMLTIKNKPQIVRDAFNLHHGQLCISTVTLMKLVYGTEKSAAPEKNLAVVEGLRRDFRCSPTTTTLPHTPA